MWGQRAAVTDVAALSWEWAGNSRASFPSYIHTGQAQPGTGSGCRSLGAQGQGLVQMGPDRLPLSSHSVRPSWEGESMLVSIPTLQPLSPGRTPPSDPAPQDFTKGSETVACSQVQWWTPGRRITVGFRPVCAA